MLKTDTLSIPKGWPHFVKMHNIGRVIFGNVGLSDF